MTAGRAANGNYSLRIESVLLGVATDPPDGSLSIEYLCRPAEIVVGTVVRSDDRVAAVKHRFGEGRDSVSLIAAAPAATVNEKENAVGLFTLNGQIDIQFLSIMLGGIGNIKGSRRTESFSGKCIIRFGHGRRGRTVIINHIHFSFMHVIVWCIMDDSGTKCNINH